MELGYYREFIELARTLNYREAASRLCMSPSALSKHIRVLEDAYQTPLFIRDRRQVAITSAGSILLEHARAICRAYDDSVAAMAEARTYRPLILAGLVEGVEEQRVMLDVMREIGRAGIERRVRVHTTGTLDLADHVASIKNGQHDCFVCYDLAKRIEDPDIQVVPICTIPLNVVVSAKNALAAKNRISVAEMAGATFIHLAGSFFTPIWNCIESRLEAFGIPHTTQPVPTGSAYDYFNLELGTSVLVVPRRATMDMYSAIPQMEAKTLTVDDPGFSLELDAAYLKSAENDKDIQVLVNALKSAYLTACGE